MLEPADDLLHGGPADDPSWTETWWYPVYVPEERTAAYLYAVVRPVAGLAAGGIIVWDDRTDTLSDALYADYRWADPFAHDGGNELRFRSGLSITISDPLDTSVITYRNAEEGVAIDVVFRATAVAHNPSKEAKDKGIKGHFDQPGLIEGTIRVAGRDIAVRSYGVRDRSWGPRPDAGKRWWGDRIGYTTGASAEFAFLAVSHPQSLERAVVFDGFIDEGGARHAIASGSRELHYGSDGRIERVELQLVDDRGREHRLDGTVRSHCTFPSIPAMMTTVSMVTWTAADRDSLIGEDQDVWWQHRWRAFARSRPPIG